jgi:hypothetical protein
MLQPGNKPLSLLDAVAAARARRSTLPALPADRVLGTAAAAARRPAYR